MTAPTVLRALSDSHQIPGHDLHVAHVRGETRELLCVLGCEVGAGDYVLFHPDNYVWFFGNFCVVFDLQAENLTRKS